MIRLRTNTGELARTV